MKTSHKLLLLWLIVGSALAFYIRKKLSGHTGLNPAILQMVGDREIHDIKAIQFQSELADVKFYRLRYSNQRNCAADCDASHLCVLERSDFVDVFWAKWRDPGEAPVFPDGTCEKLTENSCQSYLRGWPYWKTPFKEFYAELTLGRHADFKECLTSDLKVRVKLMNSN